MNFNFKDVNNDVSKDSPISAQLIGIKMCQKKKKKGRKRKLRNVFLVSTELWRDEKRHRGHKLKKCAFMGKGRANCNGATSRKRNWVFFFQP